MDTDKATNRKVNWSMVIKGSDEVNFTIPSFKGNKEQNKNVSQGRHNCYTSKDSTMCLGAVNPDLYVVEKYDSQTKEDSPGGSFASDDENDFPPDHRGRIWFTLDYNKEEEKLVLSLLKGRNLHIKNGEKELETPTTNTFTTAKKVSSLPKMRRQLAQFKSRSESVASDAREMMASAKLKRTIRMLRTVSMFESSGSREHLTKETTKPKEPTTNKNSNNNNNKGKAAPSLSSTLSVIKLSKQAKGESLIVKIYLLPDKRIQSQAKCKRGLPDPVFAERFVFQMSTDSIASKSIQMVFALVDKDGHHSLMGDVIYPLSRQIKNGEIIYEDLHKSLPIPSLFPDRIHCEMQLSLCYNSDLSRITVVILRARMKLPSDADYAIISCGVEVSCNISQKRTKTKVGRTIKGSYPKDTPPQNRKGIEGFNSEFSFNETYRFSVSSAQIDLTSLSISIKAKYQDKAMQDMIVIGAFMFARQDGVDQWMEMLNTPKEFVKQWHRIVLSAP